MKHAPEYYEQLALNALNESSNYRIDSPDATDWLRRSQVYATLAQAAAIAEHTEVLKRIEGVKWGKALGKE